MAGQSNYNDPRDPAAGVSLASDPYANNSEHEREILKYLLHPDDSYTAEGVYWADLPLSQRLSFITSSDAAETSRELRAVGAMTKADPLSPFAWYIRNAVLPGAGMGLEG
jgi:hypothetical protein